MKSQPLFPNPLSDEAASQLADFLYALADAYENRYFNQIRRHHSGQRNLYHPEHPWLSPPPPP
jgi:hypothetical protein